MTSAQLIAVRNHKLDPEEESKKLHVQLLTNPELRHYINEHERMIRKTFEHIFKELMIMNGIDPKLNEKGAFDLK